MAPENILSSSNLEVPDGQEIVVEIDRKEPPELPGQQAVLGTRRLKHLTSGTRRTDSGSRHPR